MADPRTHQPAGISVRGVAWGVTSIAVGIVLAATAAYFLWQRWNVPAGGPDAGNLPQVEQPALQVTPQQDRVQYFAEKQKLIESWEWIDRPKGVARIPVQQAMQIMAAHGGNAAPVRKEPQ